MIIISQYYIENSQLNLTFNLKTLFQDWPVLISQYYYIDST